MSKSSNKYSSDKLEKKERLDNGFWYQVNFLILDYFWLES